MTRPDDSGRRSPRSRSAASRTSSSRPGGRRGGDRRPWPTAPTTTRPSPAKDANDDARSRARGSATSPTPATVWALGNGPVDIDAPWPTELVERVVTSFSAPGGQVVQLALPSAHRTRPHLAPVRVDGVIDRAPDAGSDSESAEVVGVVEHLGRTARVERLPIGSTLSEAASRPFWADLVADGGPAPAAIPTSPALADEVLPHLDQSTTRGRADLVITSVPSRLIGDCGVDVVALVAARLLRVGGVLVVLTHCDWTSGELADPTGPVVTAGQNADLLYLQHIVAVHAPVRDGRFDFTALQADATDDQDAPARAVHRAMVRGLPAAHRRIHSDVLVFAQQRDHNPPDPSGTGAPSRDGAHR